MLVNADFTRGSKRALHPQLLAACSERQRSRAEGDQRPGKHAPVSASPHARETPQRSTRRATTRRAYRKRVPNQAACETGASSISMNRPVIDGLDPSSSPHPSGPGFRVIASMGVATPSAPLAVLCEVTVMVVSTQRVCASAVTIAPCVATVGHPAVVLHSVRWQTGVEQMFHPQY